MADPLSPRRGRISSRRRIWGKSLCYGGDTAASTATGEQHLTGPLPVGARSQGGRRKGGRWTSKTTKDPARRAVVDNTVDELVRLRQAHAHYRRGADVLDALTRWAAADRLPRRVLDLGAGTGNWYRSLRSLLGPAVRYVGADPNPEMADALRARTAGDPAAEVLVADASGLSVGDTFDWVGLHFVLPHVDDPAGVVRAALRHVGESGLLLAAANGESHLHRWREMQREVLGELGMGRPQDAVSVPRPTLEEIARPHPARSRECHRVGPGSVRLPRRRHSHGLLRRRPLAPWPCAVRGR